MARTQANDYGDKRRAILKSAAALFGEEGYERTPMSAVARACGVSKALLYHYYISKEALLFDIINDHLDELIDAVSGADDTTLAPEKRLRALVGALLEHYRDADDEHRVQINALSSLPDNQQRILKQQERRLVNHFSDVIGAIQPDLADGRQLLKPVTMSLFGMLNWHYMWFRPDGSISREDYADIATRLIIEGARGL
ncbi:MAG: TetR/AcrR family transcriptional regulator [Stappiaceae bacterium]